MSKQAQAKTRRNHVQPTREHSRHPTKPNNAHDAQDVRDARRALKEARKKGSVPWEQVKREAGI